MKPAAIVFAGLVNLTLIGVGLKLAGILAWPWAWILGPLAITLLAAFLGLLMALATISSDRWGDE